MSATTIEMIILTFFFRGGAKSSGETLLLVSKKQWKPARSDIEEALEVAAKVIIWALRCPKRHKATPQTTTIKIPLYGGGF